MEERKALKRSGEGQHLGEQQTLPAPGRDSRQGGVERRTVTGHDVSAVARSVDPIAQVVGVFNAQHQAAIREPSVDD
jgi:hypothetical protein